MNAKQFMASPVPFRTVPVAVPGGGEIHVKELTPAEGKELTAEVSKMYERTDNKYGEPGTIDRNKAIMACWIWFCAYDPKTEKRTFTKASIRKMVDSKTVSYLKAIQERIRYSALMGKAYPENEPEKEKNA